MMIAEGTAECALDAYARETLQRLPLADATLSLWAYVLQPMFLAQVFAEYRGRSFEETLTFARFVDLIGDALVEHKGSGRQSFSRAQEQGTLATSSEAVYGKLRRVPLSLSLGFFTEGTARLRALLPPQHLAAELPASVAELTVVVGDGKTLKRVAKRLLPARGAAGKVYGGKLLVAFLPSQGVAVAMAADPDGERNECRLVPQVVEQTRHVVNGPRLWVLDRQFCDLVQTARCSEEGDHFLIRYHKKVQFWPVPAQPATVTQDAQGRCITEEWGWLGAEANRSRRFVRRLTLTRPGEEAIILVTDLLDAGRTPAADLLTVYLARWGIERVFQQITEVFALRRLIGSTPQATVFQAAFCLLLYNMVQVMRGYIALAQPQPCRAEDVSAEQLFYDVQRELTAVRVLVPPPMMVAAYTEARSQEELCQHLHGLLDSVWTPRWRKAVNTKPRPKAAKAKQSGAHTSIHRLLYAARQEHHTEAAVA
jgi:Transposase DDE domain